LFTNYLINTMKPIRRLWLKQREQVVSEVEIRVFLSLSVW